MNEKEEKINTIKKDNSFQTIKNILNKIPNKKIVILVLLVLGLILLPSRTPDIFSRNNYTKIKKISNLATIEAYYHNVAAKEVDSTKIGKVMGDMGYKKYWIEYDGKVQFGIDAKKVIIKKPNRNNVVKIYIPKATILDKPIIIQDSMSDPITDTGFLTKIRAEDKTEAIANAQENLEEKARNDTELLDLAQERAKKFFKKYIESVGKEIGKEYTVKFIN